MREFISGPWGISLILLLGAAVVYVLGELFTPRDRCLLPAVRRLDPNHIPFHMSADRILSNRILAALEESRKWWDLEMDIELFTDRADNAGMVVQVMPTSEHFMAQLPKEQRGKLAYTVLNHTEEGGIKSAAILINTARTEKLPSAALANAIKHEMGHCLGLAHDTYKGSIMHSKVGAGKYTVTEEDRAALEEGYRLGD